MFSPYVELTVLSRSFNLNFIGTQHYRYPFKSYMLDIVGVKFTKYNITFLQVFSCFMFSSSRASDRVRKKLQIMRNFSEILCGKRVGLCGNSEKKKYWYLGLLVFNLHLFGMLCNCQGN